MMQVYSRILVPVDGSAGSDKAVDTAVLLAQACGAVLELLHVTCFDSGTDDAAEKGSWLPASVSGSMAKEASEVLAHAQARIPDNIKAEHHLLSGIPARRIVGFAEENGCDLIVMGRRGLGFVERVLMGSVSQTVMGTARCRVIVVK